MQYRKFGRLGWQVSEIGYGMWGMGGWTGSDDGESARSLQCAVDLGCNFFDTAWGYGKGHSERLLGDLVRANPGQKLYTATKIPPKSFRWPSRRTDTLDDCFPPDHIREYVESSLENLGLPSLDLIQFHVWEDSWANDDRWQRAMDDLKTQGLIKGVGVSVNRWEPWNGIQAIKTEFIDTIQVIYNIFDQAPEDELFPLCREMNIATIARVPFDEGTLIGNLTKDTQWEKGDWRNLYFVPDNLNASVDRAEALRPLVPAHMTMAELALRWILRNPDVSTIIPGMRKLANVEANIRCSDGQSFNHDLAEALKAHRWDRTPTKWSM